MPLHAVLTRTLHSISARTFQSFYKNNLDNKLALIQDTLYPENLARASSSLLHHRSLHFGSKLEPHPFHFAPYKTLPDKIYQNFQTDISTIMHSLSFKVSTDYSGRRCFPGRGAVSESELRPGRVQFGLSGFGRGARVVACASESERNGWSGSRSSSQSPGPRPSSFLSRSQTYALLKQQMEIAAKSEDYEEAARIRDSLKMLEKEEPVLWLRRLIKEAVAEERFEDAANFRDELKEIAPYSFLKCSSDATTLGIRVQVRSVYIEGRSQPSKGQHFFAYRIRITNNSEHPVQLLRRHWIVTDANGKSENVWGIGVIGQQPVILPQASFEYSSACPLSTPTGRMEGDFEMKHINRLSSQSFNVAIAPFSLSMLGEDDIL